LLSRISVVGVQLRAVARAHLFVFVTVALHVHAHGQENRGDEFHHAGIRIHLGIQPSTAASHRGGGEIHQDIAPLLASRGENLIDVAFSPADC
jgi:hypothetical protein